jgi:hypothetical protein
MEARALCFALPLVFVIAPPAVAAALVHKQNIFVQMIIRPLHIQHRPAALVPRGIERIRK